MPARPRVPSYRLHKSTGLAVVTIAGRDLYLGKFGTPESRAEYDRIVAEWLGAGRARGPTDRDDRCPDLTVNEVMDRYLDHVDGYYRKDGAPTTEARDIRYAIRAIRGLYGARPAREFGPLALKATRQQMIDGGRLCRAEINKRVGRIVRAFKWAVSEELVPPSVHDALRAVPGLRRGRTEARESDPVRPVPDAFVDAVRPHVDRRIWSMIELQRLTGMRPGEVVLMRAADLDVSGRVWFYVPSRHKTEHHGRERSVPIGPRAQEVLRPWLRPELDAYLFSPADADAERKAAMRAARKTKVQPSQRDRRKPDPKRTPGACFTVRSYWSAIRRACDKAGVPRWHPHQLRHNFATFARKQFGIDVAQIILGHSTVATTAIYAERDREKAAEIMFRIG